MSSYQYLPLPSKGDYIRLLCLLPNESEAEPLQCKLHNYSLQKLSPRTHRYEALSYVWGDPHETRPIYVDGVQLFITVNLHAALSRLRDHSFDRIIWADAICINQNDKPEKEQQIQLMVTIYGQANSVVVWLGEEADDSDRALEEIRIAGSRKSFNTSDGRIVQQAVFKLLQRTWFRRIWVLQEVAAASHIRIICGHSEIDGYAFCLGVDSLKSFYEADTGLQSLIRSVNYLIRGAIFRPSYGRLGKASKGICSLGELTDMYHTHEATERHDKVYALLGMSTDDLSKANLLPDYSVPWEKLLQRLVKFLLYEEILLQTRSDKEIAIIKGKGCILGRVISVQSGTTLDGKQGVGVVWKDISGQVDLWRWTDHWTLQTPARSILKEDLICLIQGALKPMVIRLCKDHFSVIMIAAPPPQKIRTGSVNLEWQRLLQSVKLPIRDLALVWDWENTPEGLQNFEEYGALMQSNNQVADNSKAGLENYVGDQAITLWNFALALGDVEEYENAAEKFRGALEDYETMLRRKYLLTPESKHDLTPLLLAVNSFLLKPDADRDFSQHRRTTLSWAAEGGHESVVKLLLRTDGVDVNFKDKDGQTPLLWAAKRGHLGIVEQLLQKEAEVNAAAAAERNGRTALQAAAEGGHLTVVERLLQEKADVNAVAGWNGRTALQAAAEGGYLDVVERLLQEKADVNAVAGVNGRMALQAAVDSGNRKIVKLLLERGANL